MKAKELEAAIQYLAPGASVRWNFDCQEYVVTPHRDRRREVRLSRESVDDNQWFNKVRDAMNQDHNKVPSS
jgi:hypothetical protein